MALIAAALLLAGCASSLPVYEGTRPSGDTARSTPPSGAPVPSVRGNDTGAQLARQALAMLGAPYRYGGATPAGFDCSGLVQYAYQQLGLAVPRTTEEQYSNAQLIRRRNMQPGDLLFFQFTHTVSHVGIYLGDGRFVHAPTTGRNVEIMALDQPYYRDGFIGAGRLHARL
jgi:murein DD-endopeptidase